MLVPEEPVADLACSASGLSTVVIDCESIGSQANVQCSFNGGPLHPCENNLHNCTFVIAFFHQV